VVAIRLWPTHSTRLETEPDSAFELVLEAPIVGISDVGSVALSKTGLVSALWGRIDPELD